MIMLPRTGIHDQTPLCTAAANDTSHIAAQLSCLMVYRHPLAADRIRYRLTSSSLLAAEDAVAQPTPPPSSEAQQPAARKQCRIDASFLQRKAAPAGRKGKFVGRKADAATGPKAGGVTKKTSSSMACASKRVTALLGLPPADALLNRTRSCRV